jgi:filamentous hemagglutinin
MAITWNSFVNALGEPELSNKVVSIATEIGETPVISATPPEYNDPLGKTTFYKFLNAGIEIGFRQDRLNHVHFFIHGGDGYANYTGPLVDGVAAHWTELWLTRALGPPSASGGEKKSPLLGYVHRWIKYDRVNCSIRFEFSQEGPLRKVSLIAPETGVQRHIS